MMALWSLPMRWWLRRGHDSARRRAQSGCHSRGESGACAVPRGVCGPNADVPWNFRMRCDAMTYVRSASWKIRSARPLATISAHPQSATNLRNCTASTCGSTSHRRARAARRSCLVQSNREVAARAGCPTRSGVVSARTDPGHCARVKRSSRYG